MTTAPAPAPAPSAPSTPSAGPAVGDDFADLVGRVRLDRRRCWDAHDQIPSVVCTSGVHVRVPDVGGDAVLAAAAVEVATVYASCLVVVADAAAVWPGRLPAATVEALADAERELAGMDPRCVPVGHGRTLDVARRLLAAARGWVPPVSEVVVAHAAADLIGVEDDMFFRSGSRPRTGVDRAAASQASERRLAQLWAAWRDRHVDSEDGSVRGPRTDAQVLAALTESRGGSGRPGQVQVLAELVAAWSALAEDLVAARSELRVVAVSSRWRDQAGSVNWLDPSPAVVQMMRQICAGAVARLPQSGLFVVVVPELVVEWMARTDEPVVVDVGPWPGGEVGVEVVDTLVRLSGGDPVRMPDLLPIALQLVQEGRSPAAR